MAAPLYDAHNHLQDAGLSPHRAQIFADLAQAGVRGMVVNGTSEADWGAVAALEAVDPSPRPDGAPGETGQAPGADEHSSLRLLLSFGLHPWDVGNRTADWERELSRHLAAHPRAAVGEIGLDRWILDRARPDDSRLKGLRRAPLEEQLDVFRRQLAHAAERDLPATIHCLDAFGALLEALQAGPRPRRGFLLHAYSGPAEMVPSFAKLGAYFSFNGGFLDPRKKRLHSVYQAVPADRLLVETDAPAMALPKSQQRFTLPPTDEGDSVNHPANVAAAYAGLAVWRDIAAEELAAQVALNFETLFGVLPVPSPSL